MKFLVLVSAFLFSSVALGQTHHFATTHGGLGEISGTGPWKALVTGKPCAETSWLKDAVNGDGCGQRLDNIGDYIDSATFVPAAVGTCRQVMFTSADWKFNQMVNVYFAEVPARGTKYTAISLYEESGAGDDDSTCVQETNGLTHYKYQATAS